MSYYLDIFIPPKIEQLEFDSIIQELRISQGKNPIPYTKRYTLEEARKYYSNKTRENKARVASMTQIPQRRNVEGDVISKFPTVKYVYLTKLFESKRSKISRGHKLQLKRYAVGLLTDDNHYYFSRFDNAHETLTGNLFKFYKLIFTQNVMFNKDTKICFSNSIDRDWDPPAIYLEIVASTNKIMIKKQNLTKMLKSVNFYIQKYKSTEYNKWKNMKLLKYLLSSGRMEFITDADWLDKLNMMSKQERNARIECACGIIYMHNRVIVNTINEEYKKRREMGIPPRPKRIRPKFDSIGYGRKPGCKDFYKRHKPHKRMEGYYDMRTVNLLNGGIISISDYIKENYKQ